MPAPSRELSAIDLPPTVANPALVAYRSVGIGAFGAFMRYTGMPLEKIALYMNSSQVSGANPFRQAVRLTFKEGALAPYRVVGPSSVTAWFLQYSVMGIAFQFVDHSLSQLLGVRPVYYGKELMEEATPTSADDNGQGLLFGIKTLVAPVIAATLESKVSNRAEVQRYFGPAQYQGAIANVSASQRVVGPAFGANVARNVIMCNTSFILTPITYKQYFPQEQKSVTSLFWYGLGVNVFVGNVVAITQQALWGRSLDYLKENGNICYRSVIRQGFASEGVSAFFTVPKWMSRVLMNAPAQGTLPWFYNEILPYGENTVLRLTKKLVYDPFLKQSHHSTITANSPR